MECCVEKIQNDGQALAASTSQESLSPSKILSPIVTTCSLLHDRSGRMISRISTPVSKASTVALRLSKRIADKVPNEERNVSKRLRMAGNGSEFSKHSTDREVNLQSMELKI
jgi:hypothetical protein